MCIRDRNKAIEIDDQYADAYAVRGNVLYWDLSSAPSAKIDLEKALAISPNNPYINYAYAEYLFDLSYDLIDKDKTNLAINSANEAIQYFKRSISNEGNEKNLMMKRLFPFGVKYDSYAQIGLTKFELYFWYKDNKQRKLAKETLNSAIIDYSKSIEIAPSQEETDKLEIERDFDYLDLGGYVWKDHVIDRDFALCESIDCEDSGPSFPPELVLMNEDSLKEINLTFNKLNFSRIIPFVII